MQRAIFFFALGKDINTLSRKHNLKLKTLTHSLLDILPKNAF